jgi:extracellular elastinolytic metalloproteinase
MSPLRKRNGRTHLAALALVATTLATGAAQLPALASTSAPLLSAPTVATPGDAVRALTDIDTTGTALPTAAQKLAATALGATVRWNEFGTPASLFSPGGDLGQATSTNPVTAARSWLTSHRAVLGLSTSQLAGLRLVNNQKLAQSQAHAVLFQQTFGGLAPANGSLVTVGVANRRIAYVSSSLTRTTQRPVAATLTPLQGWVKAAASVGRAVDLAGLSSVTDALGWSRFSVPGFAQQQQARIRALGFADGSVRPVVQANVVDVQGGQALGYTVLVDAVTGKVLWRHNVVDNEGDIVTANKAFSFSGAVTATECGPKHPFTIGDANAHSIVVTAGEAVTSNDITLKLFDGLGNELSSADTGTSPEVLQYTAALIPPGVYAVQVCPFKDPTVPFTEPGDYAGTILISDQAIGTGGAALPLPRWRYFLANPTLDWSAATAPHNSVVGCWKQASGCTAPTALANLAAAGPWDTNVATGLPTFTTWGNAAITHEAWANPLAPGGAAQAPYSLTRTYTTAFTDAWNNSKCDPTNLVPTGNDIDAAVGNLFVSHNRMHDWAYYLGFTESNYNLQTSNRGLNPDPTAEHDAEIGNVQAGALSGGQPSSLGRDNANQITLQDGTPGITNQYLFQPIAGAFYTPCTDGSMDMSVVGHEYTHAISNRMVGGPNDGLTSNQGGAMGESWSDLDAMEYQFANGYDMGAVSPYVIGAYATGNRVVGIRDYALDKNPLNYGDIGFDGPGQEVHSDGEIWNGTMWSVRKALVAKYDARFPYADKALQKRCAIASPTSSPLPSTQCPGNRRWIQLVFDSFLLQQGATSMLDARDAMLAADKMRYGGADQTVLWKAFASRGMGYGAATKNADSDVTRPSFAAPKVKNAKITFSGPKGMQVFVGTYEARVDPVADLSATTKTIPAYAKFQPGTYRMIAQAPGHGAQRFTLKVTAGQVRTVRPTLPVNLASLEAGAKVLGSTPGSLNVNWLFDDTEATNWGGVNGGKNVDDSHPFVTVDLAGGLRTVHRVQVSALLRPPPASPTDALPVLVGGVDDPDSGSRFTALRKFAIQACRASCATSAAKWVTIYTSSANAFPGARPRPVAPNLTLRSFDVKDTLASALRLVVLENQCTGFAGYAGEQDNDPLNDTDCKTGSDRGQFVHVAEFQVF